MYEGFAETINNIFEIIENDLVIKDRVDIPIKELNFLKSYLIFNNKYKYSYNFNNITISDNFFKKRKRIKLNQNN